jgi:hypothetical protein
VAEVADCGEDDGDAEAIGGGDDFWRPQGEEGAGGDGGCGAVELRGVRSL